MIKQSKTWVREQTENEFCPNRVREKRSSQVSMTDHVTRQLHRNIELEAFRVLDHEPPRCGVWSRVREITAWHRAHRALITWRQPDKRYKTHHRPGVRLITRNQVQENRRAFLAQRSWGVLSAKEQAERKWAIVVPQEREQNHPQHPMRSDQVEGPHTRRPVRLCQIHVRVQVYPWLDIDLPQDQET